MSKTRLEWKVGLFVGIALVLLAVLALQFSKGLTMFKKTYDIVLHSQNVGGLKPRAQVLMAGVQVGTVSDIRLAADGKSVAITLKIYGQFRIPKTAVFTMQTSGFLGDQYVAIQIPTASNEYLPSGADVFAEPSFDLQEAARSASGLIRRVDETAQKLNAGIEEVRRLLLNQQTLTNLAVATANFRAVSERAVTMMDDLQFLVATNRPALAGSGTNLLEFSEQLKDFGNRLNQVLETNGPAIDQVVKNVESSTAMLKTLLQDAQAGKGLAGALLKDEQAARNLSQTVYNLSVTTSNLNRLGLWGILWQHKPPKPKTAPAEPLESPKAREQ